MKKEFFSSNIDWKRTVCVTIISGLALFIVGFLSWYVIAFLPIENNLLKSQRVNDALTKVYNARMQASSTSGKLIPR